MSDAKKSAAVGALFAWMEANKSLRMRCLRRFSYTGRGLVGEDPPVADVNDTMGIFGNVRLMGDQNDGVAFRLQFVKESHDFIARLRI